MSAARRKTVFDGINVDTGFEQMRGAAVPQRVDLDATLDDARGLDGALCRHRVPPWAGRQ